MTPRDTGTGAVLEYMIRPALERGGYTFFLRGVGDARYRTFPEPFPSSRSRHVHILDGLAIYPKTGARIGIAAKWQQTAGTAEEKIPLEVIRLLKLVERGDIDRGYIVLGGNGWTLKPFYLSPSFMEVFASPARKNVLVIDLNDFVSLANQTKL